MNSFAIVGVAAAVALCGCGRGRAPQQEASPNTASTPVDNSLTIAGCLVPGDTTTQEGAARATSEPPPPSFTLVDVTIPSRDAGAPSGVAGTSGTAGSYHLVADKKRLDDLQRFANSRIEVKGSIVASTAAGTPDAGSARRLEVMDVRQLEPTCASKKP